MIPEATRMSACQWLSKSGELSPHAKELRDIAPRLSKPEVIEFYCFLRDKSQRWESEWRSGFSSIFAISEEELPGVDDSDRWSSILHSLVAQGDFPRVKAFIEGIGLPTWRFAPDVDERDIDVYPIDAADEVGELPTEKARRLGFSDVAVYLAEQKQRITSEYHRDWSAKYEKRS